MGEVVEPSFYRTEIIVDKNTQKQNLSTNRNGTYLAYSARNLNQEDWFLRTKDLRSNIVFDHGTNGENIFHPIWLDDKTIIYQSHTFDSCTINKIILSANGLSVPEMVSLCRKGDTTIPMASFSKDSILFVEPDQVSGASSLYLLNVLTNNKKLLVTQNNHDSDIYFIRVTPNRKHIIILTASSWFGTTIKLYDISDLNSPIWQKNIKNVLFTVGLSNTEVTYVNEHGGISVSNFYNDRTDILNTTFMKKIYSPLANQNSTFLLASLYSSSNLALINFLTNETNNITDYVGVNISLPKQIDENKFVFVSNQSGINQVWLSDFKRGDARQLSTLKYSYNISEISVEPSLNRIVITTQFGVLLLNIDAEGQYQEVLSVQNAESPVLSEDLLFYTKAKSGGYDIYQYNLHENIEKLYVKDGYKLINDSTTLYFTKYFQSGIWRKRVNNQVEFLQTPFDDLTSEQWNIKQGVLYLIDEGSLIKYDLSNNTLITLNNTRCNEPNVWFENACILIKDTPNFNEIIRITKKTKEK